jgi:hypothetical protein
MLSICTLIYAYMKYYAKNKFETFFEKTRKSMDIFIITYLELEKECILI